MSVFEDMLLGADPAYLRGLKAQVERFITETPPEAWITRNSWQCHLGDIEKALVLAETQPFWEAANEYD